MEFDGVLTGIVSECEKMVSSQAEGERHDIPRVNSAQGKIKPSQ